MGTVSSVIDISEVLGPNWSQEFLYKKKACRLRFDNGNTILDVILIFDDKFENYEVLFDHPHKTSVSTEYMNSLEGYFYGLYLIFACQRPMQEWVDSIKESFVSS